MKIYVETERLILREILPADIDGMFELDADPAVHHYLGNNPVKSIEQIPAIIEFIRKQYVDYGIGRWAVIDKRTNDFLGWAGLKYITEEQNGHIRYYDLGYRFIKRYWGKGFATEAAIATLDYGFNTLGLKEIVAIADCQNKGSNNVLRKVGFTFTNVFEIDGVPHNWYALAKNPSKHQPCKITS
ncbi:GNAT family N-acetyltransferase [Sphingobacterium paludis]|uniref:RimJ/RimL family protein N-acetyltransferase n=1 Tax=Sphingobacterium paludis TaxID=1476465 RepID=A0A4R7D910_9SPHI|nr:GNAT family N-acetyltransferase [Sphingobacterium paludis]TDS17510.1 RimJ/RimL family protein N-acetyltransferase [Sphingobacterium paludis]